MNRRDTAVRQRQSRTNLFPLQADARLQSTSHSGGFPACRVQGASKRLAAKAAAAGQDPAESVRDLVGGLSAAVRSARRELAA